MTKIEKDSQFVPVIITGSNGKKSSAFLYKPQNLVCTRYITAEALQDMGYEIKEVEVDWTQIEDVIKRVEEKQG